jgi:hypothetical protein
MIVPVTITTPDGVERSLRFTLGSRRRIARDLGRPFADIMQGLTDEELPTLIYNLCFDEDGNPPAGLSIAKLEESYDPANAKELLAEIFAAMSQGSLKKNEALDMIDKLSTTKMPIGSPSGASPVSISDSPDPRRPVRGSRASSGKSLRGSMTPSVIPTKSDSALNSLAPL